MIKAIGFDLGDTLIYYKGIPLNWSDHYEAALLVGFKKTGVIFTKDQLNECIFILNTNNTRVFPREIEITSEQIFDKIMLVINANQFQVEIIINEFFIYFQQQSTCFPETVKILNKINRRIPIGILTDVPYGMPNSFVLNDIKSFHKYIHTIITSRDIGYRKPAINGYLKLAEKLNIDISEMVYIGNEEKDIIGANNSGAYSVLINRTKKVIYYQEKEQFSNLEMMWNKIGKKIED